MAKKWLHSVDVEVDQSGRPLFGIGGCSSMAGGTKTVAAAATPEPLVGQSTPCRLVWIGARVDSDGPSRGVSEAPGSLRVRPGRRPRGVERVLGA